MRRLTILITFAATWLMLRAGADNVNVATFHSDNARTGWNSRETILAPANVNAMTFGRLWQRRLDGDVCGSPLYLAGVRIKGVVHNVVYAATNANSVYALDAVTGTILWGPVRVADPINEVQFTGSGDLTKPNGILSTPVIDIRRHTIFVCALSQPGIEQIYRVWALDIASGRIKRGWPVTIKGGYFGCKFDGGQIDQRGALLLDSDGWLYIPFGARYDRPDWHGWIVGVDTHRTSAPLRLWTPDPDVDGGGIWGVGGLSADRAGRLFAVIGNGGNNFTSGGKDLGQSIARLTPTAQGLSIRYNATDCFVPNNVQYLNDTDEDLGGGGAILVPPMPSLSHRNLLVTGGKQGVVYIVDQDRLGGLNGELFAERCFGDPNAPDLGEIRAAPAYFDAGMRGRIVYVPGEDPGPDGQKGLVALRIVVAADGKPKFDQLWTLDHVLTRPGSPTVSSNGHANGIVWIIEPEVNDNGPAGLSVLHAYNALTGAELFDSEQDSARDRLNHGRKFSAPLVVNGRVYVGTDGVAAYGLLGGGREIK